MSMKNSRRSTPLLRPARFAFMANYGSAGVVEYSTVAIHEAGRLIASRVFHSADYSTGDEMVIAIMEFATRHGIARVELADELLPPERDGSGQPVVKVKP